MYLLSILGTTLIYYQSTGRYFPSYLLGGQLSPQFPFALGLALAPENPVAHQPISPSAQQPTQESAMQTKAAKTKRWQTSRQAPANKYM